MTCYSVKIEDELRLLGTSFEGLSEQNAEARLASDGINALDKAKSHGLIYKFFQQLKDFSIIILLIAAGISFLVSFMQNDGDLTDMIVILAIVVLNAVIGVAQESRAERSLEALKKLSSPMATVIRSGKVQKISAEKVVRGDILSLSAGDLVPADARLIEALALRTDESALTGEALPSEKQAELILREDTPVADRKNMVFSSTLVVSGHGRAVVTETGMATEIGRIAGLLSGTAEETPLQKRLSGLSKILGIGALCCCGVIFLLGVVRHNNILESFMLAVSLAVAAIPEGLPAIVTIVLSRGVGKLAKNGAVIRHLPSCETLGSATVICSDKTGTLTQNKMTVTDAFLPTRGSVDPSDSSCKELLEKAALCTNSTFSKEHGKVRVMGEPTENALVNAALKLGFVPKEVSARYPRLSELPFDSRRKMMTTVHKNGNSYLVITKGTPQFVLERCSSIRAFGVDRPLTAADRRTIEKSNLQMAGNAKRVIAVAMKTQDGSSAKEQELTFLGLVGMEDPPRREAKTAVKKCREAGITPIMITGDQLLTARVIAERLDICRKDDLALEGRQLDAMSDEELRAVIKKVRVFARVTPEHKMRIVTALQNEGEIVAMTGDGVNDAPALKKADIGCAMGKNGTEVAKSAADLVLTDDNFSTIVEAVEIGRGLFDNIRKAVRFLISCNIGEIMLIFVSSLFGFPAPLLPVQLLWLNLVTDSLPAMALGAERPEKNIMQRMPAPKNQGIITKNRAIDIAIEGFLFGAISLLAFSLGKNLFSLSVGRTMAFCTLSLSEIFHSINVRTDESVFRVPLFENPQLVLSTIICVFLQVGAVLLPGASKVFDTVLLSSTQWLMVGVLCLVPLVVTEIEKAIGERHARKDMASETKKVRQEAKAAVSAAAGKEF